MPKASAKLTSEKTVGKPVETVPQIFVDQKHIGGCTDFEASGKRESRPVCLSQFICSMNDCAGVSSRAQINKKHNAPSAHQNTALNTHAISCQNVRWVTKNSRIVTMQTGAASIAPSKGRSTRRPRRETARRRPPAAKRRAGPAPGCRWREMPFHM